MCVDNCEFLKHTYKFPKWNEATIGEIKALVAILLSIGLVHQQVLQDYWSSFEWVVSFPWGCDRETWEVGAVHQAYPWTEGKCWAVSPSPSEGDTLGVATTYNVSGIFYCML